MYLHTTSVDAAYADKMAAEALEQTAHERYQAEPCVGLWIEWQRTLRDLEIAKARYLDRLVAEQHALAQL